MSETGFHQNETVIVNQVGYNTPKPVADELMRMAEQIDALREVLAFYADEDNWTEPKQANRYELFDTAMGNDLGDRARASLGGFKVQAIDRLPHKPALNVDSIARRIALAASELDDNTDPNDEDAIVITLRDLEAVAHRHITVEIERAALNASEKSDG